ncbi:MAG: YifB family Mg chelatase-like AAA ATPase [Casimicrobiaceae bacterium]|nr:YifB family Mg chelatase-like AAA ATPase [Casimicrobiaceae bacterium]MCX8099050.1 YifB family Mg chelatase-like AAA ATPase [Casimicrobiaceae bacterium]MDW8312585.1 YifB family Mg chelatase-like AAA ATPase [Burkholderiales bacterium]
MSLATVRTRALLGMRAEPVTVEVHLANGLPAFNLVGLPETEVRESRDRVRAAIQTAGFEFPQRRLTVNLAPADLPKESGRFDLPIALGVLAASGQLPAEGLARYEFAGELGLGGELKPVRGALAMALAAAAAGHPIVLPTASACEVGRTRAEVYAADSLLAVAAHVAGRASLPAAPPSPAPAQPRPCPDLLEVRGQAQAKRALEIAAAGGHSLLMIGPPGSGKSMLAERLPGIMPPMSEHEALESAALLSLAGQFEADRFGERPFRAPHHGASAAALVGGGTVPRPGEISLAHHGVLFLDELPEFDRRVLESLREPLETGHIHIARAARQVRFPARFQLIAAMNPCPDGYYGSSRAAAVCRCTPEQVARYRARISGPLLDRIDLRILVGPVEPRVLREAPSGESSAQVRARVIAARERQIARQGVPNAVLAAGQLDAVAICAPAAQELLLKAAERLGLSGRGLHRLLRVARTIADLAGCDSIGATHMAEALSYRIEF